MKQSTSITKRFIAFVIAFVMLVAAVPTNVFAARYLGPGSTAPVDDALNRLTQMVSNISIENVPAASQGSDDDREAYVEAEIKKVYDTEKGLIAGVANALDRLNTAAINIKSAVTGTYEAATDLLIKQSELNVLLDDETGTAALTTTRVKIQLASTTTKIKVSSLTNVSGVTSLGVTSANVMTNVSIRNNAVTAALDGINAKLGIINNYVPANTPVDQAAWITRLEEIKDVVSDISDLFDDLLTHTKNINVTYKAEIANALQQLTLAISQHTQVGISTLVGVGGIGSLTGVSVEKTVAKVMAYRAGIAAKSTLTNTLAGEAHFISTAKSGYSEYSRAISNATFVVDYLGSGNYAVTVQVSLDGIVKADVRTITVGSEALNDATARLEAVRSAIEEGQYVLTATDAAKHQETKNDIVKALVADARPTQYKTGDKIVTVLSVGYVAGTYRVTLKDDDSGQQLPQFPVTVIEEAATPATQVAKFKEAIEKLASVNQSTTGITVPIDKQTPIETRIEYIKANIELVRPKNNSTIVQNVTYLGNGIYNVHLKNGSQATQFTVTITDVTYSNQEKLSMAKEAVLAGAYEVYSASVPTINNVITTAAQALVTAKPGCTGVTITVVELDGSYHAILTAGLMNSEFEIPASQVKIWKAQEEFDLAEAALLAEPYPIPADKDTQALKTAWVQGEVTAILQAITGFVAQATVTYADSEDKYLATLTVSGITKVITLDAIPDPGVDLTAYKAAIALAEAAVVDEDLYTEESFDAFSAVWALCDKNLTAISTTAEVSAATAMINVALNLLVLKVPAVPALTLTPETTQAEAITLKVALTGVTATVYHWHRVNWADQTTLEGEYQYIGATTVPELEVAAPGPGNWGYHVSISDGKGGLLHSNYATLISSEVGTPTAVQDGNKVTLSLAGDATGATLYHWHRVNWENQATELGAYTFIGTTTTPTMEVVIPDAPTGIWGYQAATASASDPYNVTGYSYWTNVVAK